MPDRAARAVIHRIEQAALAALAEGEQHLAVAVSGGADSTAVLIALAERAPRHGWRLQALYLDHGIAAPGQRAAFLAAVTTLCERFSVPLCTATALVPQRAVAERLSLETAARRERYRFLAQRGQALGVDAIVTGHTLDDQAETVLMHLIRGSGLDGLAGMRPRSPLPEAGAAAGAPPLIRPLLGLRRHQTEALCRAFGQNYVEDPGNRDLAHTRNRVRREVLPALAKLNPRIAEALAALAESAAPERDLLRRLTAEAESALSVAPAPEGGGIVVSRRALNALPPAIRTRVVRGLALRLGGAALSHERTAALLDLAARGGHQVECGDGVVAVARGDRLWLQPPSGPRGDQA